MKRALNAVGHFLAENFSGAFRGSRLRCSGDGLVAAGRGQLDDRVDRRFVGTPPPTPPATPATSARRRILRALSVAPATSRPRHRHPAERAAERRGEGVRDKICVTGLRGFPDVMGGIEAHCENLYPRLRDVAPELDFVVLARSPYVGGHAYVHRGIAVKPVPTVKSRHLETALHTFLSVLQARFAENATGIHIHAIGPCLFAPLARALGLRVIATHHGHDYERLKWGRLARTALRLGERLMVVASDQVICVSGATAELLRRKYPDRADRIHHIPNGAAVPAAAEDDDALLTELGVADTPFILAVGRLVPEKGFHDLVAAFERTALPHKLLIVGAADHADSYSATLLRRASGRVRFAGRRSQRAVMALYARAALFVLPSYHEGHPIVALEALSAGAPILLSDIAANQEIDLPPHHYFPVGDVASLRARLEEGDFTGLQVRDETVRRRFGWDVPARETACLLQDLMSRTHRADRR